MSLKIKAGILVTNNFDNQIKNRQKKLYIYPIFKEVVWINTEYNDTHTDQIIW